MKKGKTEKREKRKRKGRKERCPHDVIGRNAHNYRYIFFVFLSLYIGRNAQNLKEMARASSSTLSLLELLSELS